MADRRGRTIAVVLAVLSTALIWAAPPSQGATIQKASSVTMVSEGEYIGGSGAREWDSQSGSVTLSGSPSEIQVSVSGGTSGDDFIMTFAAPPGQPLTVGSYEGAQRTPFRSAGRPGIDIYGEGRSCNEVTGRFDILDMEGVGGGASRLWLVYEHHCEGGPRSLFGEVRINQPLNSGALLVAPRAIRWPSADGAGATGVVVPVVVRNVSADPVKLGAADVGGSKPAEFPIRADECTGMTLQPGASCEVWVGSTPKAAGSRTATLKIPNDVDTTAPSVKLDAYVLPGVTSWTMDSEPGDYIGGGASYSFTPANAQITIRGDRNGIHASLTAASSYWYADFEPGPGDIITKGTYTGAIRYPFNESGPGLSVHGEHRGCNQLTGEFTVRGVVFSPTDGSLTQLALEFVQNCEGYMPPLRGELLLRWTDGDTEVVPPRQPIVVPTTTTTTTRPPTSTTTAPTTTTTTRAQGSTTTTTALPATTTTTTAPQSSTDPGTHTAVVSGQADGYRMVDADGQVYGFGEARSLGHASLAAGVRAVDLETSPVGNGYWVLGSDGTVHPFGDARRLGGLARGALSAGETATSLSATRTGAGYWVFTSRGRAISFGDATFFGDMAGHRLNAPVLDSIPTATGHGYYMVASDGGIFSFGDARFYGSMGGVRLNSPVRSLVPDPDGAGYWLVAGDGGIFAFDAPFRGSMGGQRLNRAVTGMVPFGDGYLMVAEDGGVFNFSNRQFLGSLGGRPPASPVVSIAAG